MNSGEWDYLKRLGDATLGVLRCRERIDAGDVAGAEHEMRIFERLLAGLEGTTSGGVDVPLRELVDEAEALAAAVRARTPSARATQQAFAAG